MCDSCTAISIAKNLVLHNKAKHIKMKYHAVRYYEDKKDIQVTFCCTQEQLGDIFTKPLCKARYKDPKANLEYAV